jgi:hypothetical protein
LLSVSNEAFFHVFDYLGQGVTLTDPLINYRVHDSNMTDRAHPGVFQDYLRHVNLEIAKRLRDLSLSPPDWAARGPLRRLSWHFAATAGGHAREAAVQRRQRGAALTALSAELCAALAARRACASHWAGMRSAILMRPTVVLGRSRE